MTEQFPSDKTPWTDLGRYLAGELDVDERAALERWIDASADRVALLEELRRLWAVAPIAREQWEVEAAVRRVMQPAAEPARVIRLPTYYRETPGSRTERVRRLALRAAAVAAVIAGGIWLLRRPAADDAAATVAMSEVRTRPGQWAELRLPDGTEAKLGPASVMRYAVDSRRGPRSVDLDGELYLSVVHDATRPFTIRTAYGIAVDRGTRFGIRAYRSDSIVEVAVEEGSVALAPVQGRGSGQEPEGSGVLLRAGDIGTARADGRVAMERRGDVAAELAWKDGRLNLHGVSLKTAVVRLARWYGIEIRLGDTLSAGRRLQASFQQESATEAVQLIAATLALRIERHGSSVILWSK